MVEEFNRSGDPAERVNHPAHYGGDTTYEAIKVINAWGPLNFNLGTVVKYIVRAGHKPNADNIEDLEKAQFYLNWEVDRLRRERDHERAEGRSAAADV